MSKLIEQFDLFDVAIAPVTERFNIAPSQPILAVRTPATERGMTAAPESASGEATLLREIVSLRWGLIPSWADDPKIGNKLINARGETVSSKPSFRHAFRRRRCLVPADGFYEWQKRGNEKQPFHIRLAEGGPFAIAGLWERWQRDGKTIESCSLITTGANAVMQPIHDRMPVILPPRAYGTWLDVSKSETSAVEELLVPFAGQLIARPVDRWVNSPTHDGEGCLAPPTAA